MLINQHRFPLSFFPSKIQYNTRKMLTNALIVPYRTTPKPPEFRLAPPSDYSDYNPKFDADDYAGSDTYSPHPTPEMLMIIDHDGQPRYMCSRCNVKYKDASRLQHHLRECGHGAQCPICGFVCKQRRNLPDHIMTHDKQSPQYRRHRMMRARRRLCRQQMQEQRRMAAAATVASGRRRIRTAQFAEQ